MDVPIEAVGAVVAALLGGGGGVALYGRRRGDAGHAEAPVPPPHRCASAVEGQVADLHVHLMRRDDTGAVVLLSEARKMREILEDIRDALAPRRPPMGSRPEAAE